jgi:hypothetical protein
LLVHVESLQLAQPLSLGQRVLDQLGAVSAFIYALILGTILGSVVAVFDTFQVINPAHPEMVKGEFSFWERGVYENAENKAVRKVLHRMDAKG